MASNAAPAAAPQAAGITLTTDIPPATGEFSRLFTSMEDKGYKVMIDRLRAGKHTAKQVCEVFNARVTLEHEYTVRLNKAFKVLGNEDSGSMKDLVDSLRTESDSLVRYHVEYAEFLRNKLEKPLQDLLARHKILRESHLATAERNLRHRANCQQAHARAKDRLAAKATEVAAARDAVRTKYGKENEKAQARLTKSEAAIKAAEIEHTQAHDALETAHKTWEVDWARSLAEFERLELERLVVLKDLVTQFATASRDMATKEAKVYERLIEKANQVSAPADLATFMADLSLTASPVDPDAPTSVGAAATSVVGPTPQRNLLNPFSFRKKMGSFELGGLLRPAHSGTTANAASSSPPTGAAQIPPSGSMTPASPTADAADHPSFLPPPVAMSSGLEIDLPPPLDAGEIEDEPSGATATAPRAPVPVDAASAPPYLPGSLSALDLAPGSMQMPVPQPVGAAALQVPMDATGAANDPAPDGDAPGIDFLDLSVTFPIKCMTRALYAYDASIPEELSFEAGQVLPIIDLDDQGWWVAEVVDNRTGARRRGLIPSNFVEVIHGE
ncbi:hypothetical protein GGF32_009277 [Allomyces javanicus]|nr:hypothetical protein GGF32_009277 [Allomyces javanicus]